jgi:D-alanine-D-alanine ligase
VLVEKYISGREINVPLLEGHALPWSEIDFSTMPKDLPPIITYLGKWDEQSAEYLGSMPRLAPQLTPALTAAIREAAAGAFAALECRGYARVDLRVDASGQPFVIDLNPNCDLSPQGGFFKAVQAAPLSYADMVLHIAQLALGSPLVISHSPHSHDVRPRLAAVARSRRSPARLHARGAASRARAD